MGVLNQLSSVGVRAWGGGESNLPLPRSICGLVYGPHHLTSVARKQMRSAHIQLFAGNDKKKQNGFNLFIWI